MKHSATTSSIAHRPLALINARLIDPGALSEIAGGVLVVDGVIREASAGVVLANLPAHAQIIDCRGDCVAPGLIDMRAFIGEPGAEHRETIATATLAAAAGGVTTILARPDTNPPVDEPAVVDFLLRRARDTGRVRVLPSAALTAGLKGTEIAEIGLLQQAGAVALSMPQTYYAGLAATYTKKRDIILAQLNAAGLIAYKPQGAYYVMCDIANFGFADDVAFTQHLIANVGVACVPGSSFFADPRKGKDIVRFCFCKKEETLLEAGVRLRKLSER